MTESLRDGNTEEAIRIFSQVREDYNQTVSAIKKLNII